MQKECDTRDEAVMKIHKKFKTGIPETDTFSVITKVNLKLKFWD